MKGGAHFGNNSNNWPEALENHILDFKAALLFWFFGGFRCGVPLFFVMLVIY